MPGPDAFAPLAVDRRLGGRYRLIGPIARGGMAEVWEGYDEVLSRPVAVKVLLSHLATDEVVRERFRREAVTAARLAHPNVVATYDTGLDGTTAYIVMELVRGQTLRHLLAARGALSVPVAIAVADQIADALAQAHRAGLVHRDIKPANVLLAEEDGTLPRIKVTDFGIAKAAERVGADLTSTGMVLGTPKYLSPEQVEGREPDARADLYSLGVVLFEMLTARPPFVGPTEMATALSHLRDDAPLASSFRPGLPPAIDDVVATLLAKDPAWRYPSANDLRRALAAVNPRAAVFDGLADLRTPVAPRRPPAESAPTVANGATARLPPPTGRLPGTSANGTTRNGTRPPPAPNGRLPGGSAIAGPVGTSPTRLPGVSPPRRVPGASDPTGISGSPPPTRVSGSSGQATSPTRFARPAPGDARTERWPHAVPVPDRTPTGARRPPDQGGDRADRLDPAGGNDRQRGAAGRRRRRRGPGLVVATLVAAGAIVAAVILTRPNAPAGGTGTAATPLALLGAQVFVLAGHQPDDPAGAGNAIDGNPATVWQTDLYGNAHFGNLYPGIGLAIEIKGSHTLHQMTVVSPAGGWSAEAFVSTTLPADSTGVGVWGSPTDGHTAAGTTTTFSLGGRTGSWVLLWLTSTGGPPYRAEIGDVSIT